MASSLVPSCLETPGPGGPSSTLTVSLQDHFWETASLRTASLELWGQPLRDCDMGLQGRRGVED